MSPRQAASCQVFTGSAAPLVKCDFDNSGTITRTDYGAFAQTEQPNEFFTQGLVDIQVNGFAGVDFSNPGLTAVQMDHALAHLAASGVTCVLPTLITATENEFLNRLEALDKAVSDSDLGPLMVPGYHIEGPFLSPTDGCAGAHPASAMRPGSRQLITRFTGRIIAPDFDPDRRTRARWCARSHSVSDQTGYYLRHRPHGSIPN